MQADCECHRRLQVVVGPPGKGCVHNINRVLACSSLSCRGVRRSTSKCYLRSCLQCHEALSVNEQTDRCTQAIQHPKLQRDAQDRHVHAMGTRGKWNRQPERLVKGEVGGDLNVEIDGDLTLNLKVERAHWLRQASLHLELHVRRLHVHLTPAIQALHGQSIVWRLESVRTMRTSRYWIVVEIAVYRVGDRKGLRSSVVAHPTSKQSTVVLEGNEHGEERTLQYHERGSFCVCSDLTNVRRRLVPHGEKRKILFEGYAHVGVGGELARASLP
mmetsp:Transcript_5742/g.18682  ORF Transcript_5742/g.18682 Transcript_5742/m.18682 type:complete len:272 (+) Transcript_5742:464-1279(+)